jgi:hypothetical protein
VFGLVLINPKGHIILFQFWEFHYFHSVYIETSLSFSILILGFLSISEQSYIMSDIAANLGLYIYMRNNKGSSYVVDVGMRFL